LIRSRLVHFG